MLDDDEGFLPVDLATLRPTSEDWTELQTPIDLASIGVSAEEFFHQDPKS